MNNLRPRDLLHPGIKKLGRLQATSGESTMLRSPGCDGLRLADWRRKCPAGSLVGPLAE